MAAVYWEWDQESFLHTVEKRNLSAPILRLGKGAPKNTPSLRSYALQ